MTIGQTVLDLGSTANSLQKQVCPRPSTLGMKSSEEHCMTRACTFLCPLTTSQPHTLEPNSCINCGSQTHQSRTEDPNTGTFLDPVKIIEMYRPLSQFCSRMIAFGHILDKFSWEIPWDQAFSSFIWFVIVSHWSTQSTILRGIILPSPRKQSAFTTWEGHRGVLLDFLWKLPDVQQLPRGQTDCEQKHRGQNRKC